MENDCPFYPSVPQTTELYNRKFCAVSSSGHLHTFSFDANGEFCWQAPGCESVTFSEAAIKVDERVYLLLPDENDALISAVILKPEGPRTDIWIFSRGKTACQVFRKTASLPFYPVCPPVAITLEGPTETVTASLADHHLQSFKPDGFPAFQQGAKVYCTEGPQGWIIVLSGTNTHSLLAIIPAANQSGKLAHGSWNGIPFSTPGSFIPLPNPPMPLSSALSCQEKEPEKETAEKVVMKLSLPLPLPQLRLWEKLLYKLPLIRRLFCKNQDGNKK